MVISERLAKIDPSRLTVYELLDYVKDSINIQLIQQETDNLFLVKTEPYLDSLYNYAHVLGGKFEADDLAVVKDFFGDDDFRIKMPADINADILLVNGFFLRDSGYSMLTDNFQDLDINYSLTAGLEIAPVTTDTAWGQSRAIFCEAFEKQIYEYDQKFGFLKKLALDGADGKICFFLLHENGVPVSSGAYYALSKFSIENIGTLKTARGRGYAGLMIRFLLNEAQRLGYNEACLVGSEAAVSIYQKAGFKILSKNNTFIK